MGSILKKGLFLVTFSGAALALPATVQASDTAADPVMPSVGIEEVLSDCYSSGQEIDASDYLVPTEKGEYLDMAFADVDSFLYIRSEPTKQSAWVGKLYPDYAAKITGPVDEWTKIQSGSVEGYVYSDYIIIGNNAEQKAQEIIEEAQEEDPKEEPEEAFTYAEFGVSLPRTSAEMRGSGRAVSYSEAIPGDIICYDGHVGIYMGDGQIVNAINSARGIGIISATYTDIITVRRLL